MRGGLGGEAVVAMNEWDQYEKQVKRKAIVLIAATIVLKIIGFGIFVMIVALIVKWLLK